MVNLEIYFKTVHEVELKLWEGDKIIDRKKFWPPVDEAVDFHPHTYFLEAEGSKTGQKVSVRVHFDTMLVTSIDRILKENKIDKVSLGEASVTGNPDPMSVAYNVALVAAAAIKAK